MKKVIRLTESDLLKIVKKVINENLGISGEAEKLAKIIVDNLPRLKEEPEILIDENINILNIEEIIIRDRGYQNPHFNKIESIIIPEGVRLVFGLSIKDAYSTILHEAFHGIDFIYKKGKFDSKLPFFQQDTALKLPILYSDKYRLGSLLYLLNDEEVKAHLHGAYITGKEFYKTLTGTKDEKRNQLYKFLNKENSFYQDYMMYSDPMILLNKLKKPLLQKLTYGYYNENGENEYTRLLGVLNHYFRLKPKYNTITDSDIEKFKKELSRKLRAGFERFRKGLGRIVMKIESEFED